MRADWDLVRQLLLAVEALPDTRSTLDAADLPPYDKDAVAYHIRMLHQAGLIDADYAEDPNGLNGWANSLTFEGHKFLDRIRDQTVWDRVKATVRAKGVALSFEVIKTIATGFIGKMLG